MKYTLYIDYKKGGKYEYISMNAKTLEDAIEEADKVWNEKAETIYLARIMNKVGKIETPERGIKQETYEAYICRRSNGWHRNIIENSENYHAAHKTWFAKNQNDAWYECI